MPFWWVPVTLVQPDEYEELSPSAVLELDLSLPGGGTSGSGDDQYITGPRKFTKSVEVEADDPDAAEEAARALMDSSIDNEKYPGWRVETTGEPELQ